MDSPVAAQSGAAATSTITITPVEVAATLSDVAGDDNTAGSNADGFAQQSDGGSLAFVFGTDLPVTFATSYDGGLGAATDSSVAGMTTFASNDGTWNVTIDETTGDFGSLTLKADGSWSYAPNSRVPPGLNGCRFQHQY